MGTSLNHQIVPYLSIQFNVHEVHVYRKDDEFAGFVVRFKESGSREAHEEVPVFEVFFTAVSHLQVNEQANSDIQTRVTGVEVSTAKFVSLHS